MQSRPNPIWSRTGAQHRGAVLVAAVVCLVIAMLVGAALVRCLTIQQRQSRETEQRLQALWLAESAAGRAAARLSADAAYSGETWDIVWPAAGVVRIQVEPLADQPAQRRVRIEARTSADPLRGSMHRKELVIHLPNTGDAP